MGLCPIALAPAPCSPNAAQGGGQSSAHPLGVCVPPNRDFSCACVLRRLTLTPAQLGGVPGDLVAAARHTYPCPAAPRAAAAVRVHQRAGYLVSTAQAYKKGRCPLRNDPISRHRPPKGTSVHDLIIGSSGASCATSITEQARHVKAKMGKGGSLARGSPEEEYSGFDEHSIPLKPEFVNGEFCIT